ASAEISIVATYGNKAILRADERVYFVKSGDVITHGKNQLGVAVEGDIVRLSNAYGTTIFSGYVGTGKVLKLPDEEEGEVKYEGNSEATGTGSSSASSSSSSSSN